MACTMIKPRQPFDLLLRWPVYAKMIIQQFSEPEQENIWVPAVDIEEKDGQYLIMADLPGVKEEDINVSLKNGYLVINGQRQRDCSEGEKRQFMGERYYGRFERVFKLPEGVKEIEIKKEYKDGILFITIPIPEGHKIEKHPVA